MEEEEESQTPLQLTFKEGEDLESLNKEYCGSNNRVTVESWNQEECGASSYVCDHRHTYKWGSSTKL